VRNQRKKIWIDRFQTSLSVRIAAYCVLYQAAVWLLVGIERSIFAALEAIVGPGVAGGCFLFLASAVVLLGFLFVYDAVRFAHRIVGPLYRFRKTLKAIAAAEELELVNLRQGDFLLEMRDDFNEMIRALEQRGAVTLKTADAGRDAKQPVSA
jgi:methyl-accepting chemotaxis protein